MIPILTPGECAALDRESEARGVGTRLLMENAGWAVAHAALLLTGGAYGRRAVILCGKGHNGGDGLVAARRLRRHGMGVTVVLVAEPAELRGAAAANFRRYAAAGGRWRRFGPDILARELARADVVVDALFGTGFRGEPEGDHARAIQAVNEALAPVLAVDIPSGVDGSSGTVRGTAIEARATVTFGALKPGLVFHPGASLAGLISLVDIGFPENLVRSDLGLVERADVAALLPRREAESHKRSSGVVVIVAGSRSMTGAAVLAARAAVRAGAGLVTLAVPLGILPVVEGAVAEATFLPLPETPEGTAAPGALPMLTQRLEGADALAVGPGLSSNSETAELVRAVVGASTVPMVIDADALNAVAARPSDLSARRPDAVLTPHGGEFARLTGVPAADLPQDRVGHARKAAAHLGCTVLLKGSRTVVAEPSGRARVNPTGGPYLATAGTGDVLTGTIVALIAQGLGPADAGVAGAYLHGLAGRQASEGRGGRISASDVAARLPDAVAEVLG